MPDADGSLEVHVYVYYRVLATAQVQLRSLVASLFSLLAHATCHPPRLYARIPANSTEMTSQTWMEHYVLVATAWQPFVQMLEEKSRELNLLSATEGNRHIEVFGPCA